MKPKVQFWINFTSNVKQFTHMPRRGAHTSLKPSFINKISSFVLQLREAVRHRWCAASAPILTYLKENTFCVHRWKDSNFPPGVTFIYKYILCSSELKLKKAAQLRKYQPGVSRPGPTGLQSIQVFCATRQKTLIPRTGFGNPWF